MRAPFYHSKNNERTGKNYEESNEQCTDRKRNAGENI